VSYFINRELSWLKFNKRVLEQAASSSVPIFERYKFLSIFTSNLDEFFMVRAGSMHDRILGGNLPDDKTGMTASEQLNAIYEAARPLYAQRDAYYRAVIKDLAEYNIKQLKIKDLNESQSKFVKQYFKREMLPLLSPQIIDTKHLFPHLENKRFYILLALKNNDKPYYGIIPVPPMFGRILYLDTLTYILTEDILLKYAGTIYKQYTITARAIVKITRNADVEVADNFSDEDIDYRDYVNIIIKRREKLAPVRMEIYSGSYPKNLKLIKFFMERAGLSENQCYTSTAPLDMSYVYSLEGNIPRNGELLYNPLTPRQDKSLQTGSISDIAKECDILLSYPYYSMKPYLKMLEEAAYDPNTVSIKITLYRLSANSEVIRLLCAAAENGREVTVVVELKARFDESNNIDWSRRLENAGCRVIYGIDGLKVHSKITLIVSRKDEKVYHLVHIATGNYNEKTALLYTDLGIITTNPIICEDAVNFFNNITLGMAHHDDYNALLVAPSGLKPRVIEEIRRETELGADGYICMKMNGLTDKNIIDELVKASQAGVKIDLLIRGICCLLPGIVGVTDNITVRSIVGRFLEHSRIGIFGDRVYIGSADLMTRNTTRRVEIWMPVFDKIIAEEIRNMTKIILRDNVKSSILCSNGDYEYLITDSPSLDSQIYFYEEAYRKNN